MLTTQWRHLDLWKKVLFHICEQIWWPTLFLNNKLDNCKPFHKSRNDGLPDLKLFLPQLLYVPSRRMFIYLYVDVGILNATYACKDSYKICILNFYCIITSLFFYSLVALTWWHRHVGVQNYSKMSLKFCIIKESNSQKISFAIVLSANMAVVTSGANEKLYWAVMPVLVT